MISTQDLVLSLFSVAVWYGFIYYWLYVLKHPVLLYKAALVLLVLAIVGTVSCPWVHHTDAWRRLWRS